MSSIRTLRTFLAVARHGSFAAAGQEIGLTAAAVGQQVRALEAELHLTLFDRSARSIVLNTTGRGLVTPVLELVARYEALAARPRDAQLGGTVVMGALVSALMGAFADCLWALKKRHPALVVSLLARPTRGARRMHPANSVIPTWPRHFIRRAVRCAEESPRSRRARISSAALRERRTRPCSHRRRTRSIPRALDAYI